MTPEAPSSDPEPSPLAMAFARAADLAAAQSRSLVYRIAARALVGTPDGPEALDDQGRAGLAVDRAERMFARACAALPKRVRLADLGPADYPPVRVADRPAHAALPRDDEPFPGEAPDPLPATVTRPQAPTPSDAALMEAAFEGAWLNVLEDPDDQAVS